MSALDFNDRPRLVFWETTKACPLACVHCRAFAQSTPLPGELDTNEGMRLIDELAACARPRPILVLTGGDCLARADIVELAAYAHSVEVPVAIAPSVSPGMTPKLLDQLRATGVTHASLSLDGAIPETHDNIRGIPGHLEATLDAIQLLTRHGFQVQINTAVMARNVNELADIAALLYWAGVRIWEVFFLINVGRGDDVEDITPGDAEDVCHFLVEAAQYGMIVRTVEAPFFRRVHKQRERVADAEIAEVFKLGDLYERLSERLTIQLGAPSTRVLAPTVATRDGKGIIFVAHNGDVSPSGFMPLLLGNVRQSPLMSIYRQHPTLLSIRASEFPGRCGQCEYSDLCGGSRARAYAATGDPLADDPACIVTAVPVPV